MPPPLSSSSVPKSRPSWPSLLPSPHPRVLSLAPLHSHRRSACVGLGIGTRRETGRPPARPAALTALRYPGRARAVTVQTEGTTTGKCRVLPRRGRSCLKGRVCGTWGGGMFQTAARQGAGGGSAGWSGGCRHTPAAEGMCRPDSRIKTLLRNAGPQLPASYTLEPTDLLEPLAWCGKRVKGP